MDRRLESDEEWDEAYRTGQYVMTPKAKGVIQ
jgi:hypothetical protein